MRRTTRGWWLWLGLTALLSATAGAAPATAGAAPRFVETPLGRAPDSLVARARNRLAVTVRGAEHDTVVVDGRRYPTAGRVERLVFTPDGQQVYWYVSRRGQGQWALDGEAITPWGATRNLPVRLADGQFSWAMAEAKGVRVMHGERSLGLFAEARPTFVELGSRSESDIQSLHWPDIDRGWGAPVANGVWLDGKEHPRHVICDEGTLGPFDQIGALAMTADKRHWACFVQQGKRWALLRDGRLGDWHDKIGGPCGGCCCDGLGTPAYSASGEQLIYQTSDAGRTRLWLDDRAFEVPVTGPRNMEAKITGDGRHVLYEPTPLEAGV
ncbi:MAG: hypothetical protein HZB16_10235, partial [Armatimonadetes bacterium]|nr:hypothetical protein [Armatimonadota bacterium]